MRLFFILLGCLWGLAFPVGAQEKAELSISRFDVDLFDLSGQRSERVDANGEKYAIVKVTSTLPEDRLNEYHFNFGQMNCIVEEHEEALWLYVQRNAKHVTVSREGYKRVYRYDLKRTLESAKTYVMELHPAVPDDCRQMVVFDMAPREARAIVLVTREGAHEDFFGIQNENGVAAKSLSYGTYSYRVSSDFYQEVEGSFLLNDREKVYTEKISLVPDFSMVTLRGNSEADIYIDGKKVGKGTWKGKLKRGEHLVACRQKHHRPTSQSVLVSEANEELEFDLLPPTPVVGALFVTSTSEGTEVFIDGQKKGKTPLTIDNLLVGDHAMTLKMDHREVGQLEVAVVEADTVAVHFDAKNYVRQQRQSSSDLQNGIGKVDAEAELWVDLGLSVKWASRNVGATSPEECGDYFAWGEIRPKERYTETNSLSFQKSWGCFSGNPKYDAATSEWGTSARTPTEKEVQELLELCTFEWVISNEVAGCRLTSKINNKSIFLPAVGHRHRASLSKVGKYGYYWSSTPYEGSDEYSYGFGFEEDGSFWNWDSRDLGHCIRPVCNP